LEATDGVSADGLGRHIDAKAVVKGVKHQSNCPATNSVELNGSPDWPGYIYSPDVVTFGSNLFKEFRGLPRDSNGDYPIEVTITPDDPDCPIYIWWSINLSTGNGQI